MPQGIPSKHKEWTLKLVMYEIQLCYTPLDHSSFTPLDHLSFNMVHTMSCTRILPNHTLSKRAKKKNIIIFLKSGLSQPNAEIKLIVVCYRLFF